MPGWQKAEDLRAAKTLQTVVGLFGGPDPTASKFTIHFLKFLFGFLTTIFIRFIPLAKKAKLDAKKKEAQKDILGLPR